MAETVVNCSNNASSSNNSDLSTFNLGQLFNQVGNLPSYDEDDQIEISLSLHKSVLQNMGSDHTKILLINSLLTQCLGTLNIKPVKGSGKGSGSGGGSAFCSGDGGGGGGGGGMGAACKQESSSQNSVDKNSGPIHFPFNSQQNSGGQMDNRDFYSGGNSHLGSGGGGGGNSNRMSSFGDRNAVS